MNEKHNWTHCDSPHTFGIWRVNSWVSLAPDYSRLSCDVSATCKDWSEEKDIFYTYIYKIITVH